MKPFDVVKAQTPIMKLIFGNGTQTTHNMMGEYLNEKGVNVLPEADIIRVVMDELKANPSSTKYLMPELGWEKVKAKWGGVDYARAIRVRTGYHVEKGRVFGPGDASVPLMARAAVHDEYVGNLGVSRCPQLKLSLLRGKFTDARRNESPGCRTSWITAKRRPGRGLTPFWLRRCRIPKLAVRSRPHRHHPN